MIFQMICSLMKRETNVVTVSNAYINFFLLFLFGFCISKVFSKREGVNLPIFARAILVDNHFSSLKDNRRKWKQVISKEM